MTLLAVLIAVNKEGRHYNNFSISDFLPALLLAVESKQGMSEIMIMWPWLTVML